MTTTRTSRFLAPLCCAVALVLSAGVSTASAARPPSACAPAPGCVRGAGVITIDGVPFQIRLAGAERHIARALRDCGYVACVRGRCIEVDTRYGTPCVSWRIGSRELDTKRSCGKVQYHLRARCGPIARTHHHRDVRTYDRTSYDRRVSSPWPRFRYRTPVRSYRQRYW